MTYAPDGILGASVRFREPRGVAIQPFVMIESPRHGDHVTRGTAVNVSWRDEQVTHFRARIFDLENLGSDGEPSFVYQTEGELSPEQRTNRSMFAEFAGLFEPNTGTVSLDPYHNNRYRLEIQMMSGNVEFSRTHIDVRFEDLLGPVPVTALDLSPTIVPIAPGGSAQLDARLRPAGSPSEDVTTQASYSWLDGPSGASLAMDPSGVVNAIRSHLTASNGGTPVGFGVVPASVSPTGSVTMSGPGLQLVMARMDGIDSRPSVVLSGFSVERISLEAIGAEGPVEAGSLGARAIAALGRGVNAPLIIAPTDSTFVDDDGQVELDDVVLRYVGGGTIRLNDLMAAMRLLIEADFVDAINGNLTPTPLPTWRYAQGLANLMERPGGPTFNYELAFTTSSVSTAFVQHIGFFGGRIASNSSGLAVVSGTLNLGGFGTGTDSLLVWSLPGLESAAFDPSTLTIDRTEAPIPGRPVITRVTTAPASATISRPSQYATDADFITAVLPAAFSSSIGTTLGSAPRFTIFGTASTTSGLNLQDFRLTFDVPADDESHVSHVFSTGTSTLLTSEPTSRFQRRLIHQNVVGQTSISSTVSIEGLGTVSAQGLVTICDCTVTPALPAQDQQ